MRMNSLEPYFHGIENLIRILLSSLVYSLHSCLSEEIFPGIYIDSYNLALII